jgi:hypothetical protein
MKGKTVSCLLLAVALFPNWIWGNEFYNRAPEFSVPNGTIAYMGSYWAPTRVVATDGFISSAPQPLKNAGTTTVLMKNSNSSISLVDTGTPIVIGDTSPPDTDQAMNETNLGMLQKAADMNLSMVPVSFNKIYQNALLMHVLSPGKYRYNPKITQFCGNQPYILIVVIDYYADYPSSIDIREKQDGHNINYWGKRSIIEQDKNLFANQGKQNAVALEFFLVSTQDGSTVWQANTVTTKGLNSYYHDITEGLIETAFKNLMKK